MSTTETCRPTKLEPNAKPEASVGAQLPHLTIAASIANTRTSGGDPATQAATRAAQPNGEPLPGSLLPRPTMTDAGPKSLASGGDPNSVTDHESCDTQKVTVGHGSLSTASHRSHDAQVLDAGRGSTSALDRSVVDAQVPNVEGGSNSQQARKGLDSNVPSPTGADARRDRAANDATRTIDRSLFDPALAFAADILDDTEGLWVANSNRLRVLTTPADKADADGVCRGFGLTEAHHDVARLGAMVSTLEQLTKDATKHLEKVMRRHPLHPWVKAQKGLGDKQTARLLAAIGDPYWNTLHERPRTVSELWAYCGFHVLPADHPTPDTQRPCVGRGQAGVGGDPGQGPSNTHSTAAGVAPRRQRGRKANWSEAARKRAWLIANSVVKSGGPYREVYDATKDKYADAVHTTACVRCGPSGKPAQPDSPLSKAHIHARGLRAISKAVLKELWIEAKRLHELPAGDQLELESQTKDRAGRGQT